MISIIKRPYQGLYSNYNPVYNGLNFIVDSNSKLVSGFRYIAEIFVGDSSGGNKIGELRHNPDISNNNQGVFDVGRVLEDFITYTLPWNIVSQQQMANHFKKYYVQFGEEKGRTARITTMFGAAGKFRIGLATPHDLMANYSAVLIQGTSLAQLNAPLKVTSVTGNNVFDVNVAFQSGVQFTNAYIVQGAYASSGMGTYTGADGLKYYQFIHTGPGDDAAYAERNDGIVVYPEDTTKTFIQGNWRIIDKFYDAGSESFVYKTNIPYVSSMIGSPVFVFPQSVITKKNLVSTVNDRAVTFNGVFQYEDILNYNITPYAFTQGNLTRKYLTYRPRKVIPICLTDYFTLSSLGSWNMPATYGGVLGQNFAGTLVEVYLKSLPTPISQSVNAYIGTSTTLGNPLYTKVYFSGTTIANQWPQGSYVNVLFWQLVGSTWTSYTNNGARIVNVQTVTLSGNPFSEITFDIPYNSSMNANGTHIWTFTMTQRIIQRQMGFALNTGRPAASGTVRVEAGVGPKNMILNGYTEFSDNDVKKYTVTPFARDYSLVGTGQNGAYRLCRAAGETWTFEIVDCPCNGYDAHTVFWLNPLGGWDYYTFKQRTDKVRKVEARNQFRRSLYNYGTFTNGQKGQSTYTTLSNDEWTLNTDWLDQADIDWLQYIYESPEVYIILKSHTNEFGASDIITPVNVTNEEIILGNKKNRGDNGSLFQYSITMAKANRREVQRGSNYGGNYFYNRS